jgi:hypothetical protein
MPSAARGQRNEGAWVLPEKIWKLPECFRDGT